MIIEIQYGSLVFRGNRPKAHVPHTDIRPTSVFSVQGSSFFEE